MPDERTPQERAALVTERLKDGQVLTVRQVSRLTGLSRSASWRLLSTLSRVLPIARSDGEWWLLKRQ